MRERESKKDRWNTREKVRDREKGITCDWLSVCVCSDTERAKRENDRKKEWKD